MSVRTAGSSCTRRRRGPRSAHMAWSHQSVGLVDAILRAPGLLVQSPLCCCIPPYAPSVPSEDTAGEQGLLLARARCLSLGAALAEAMMEGGMESAQRLPWDRPRFVRRTSDVRLPHAFVRPGLSRARWDRVPHRSQLPLGTADPFGAVGAGSWRAPAVPGMPGAERSQAAEWSAPRLEFTHPAQTGGRVVARAAARRIEVLRR